MAPEHNDEEEGVAKKLINLHEGKQLVASLGDISEEPHELTKSEYDAKNPSKRPSKPNPSVSKGPWTTRRQNRCVHPIFSDVIADVDKFHANEFK